MMAEEYSDELKEKVDMAIHRLQSLCPRGGVLAELLRRKGQPDDLSVGEDGWRSF